MRTVQHGNGTSNHFAPAITVVQIGLERVATSAVREDVVRPLASPPRSPSNSQAVLRSTTPPVEEIDEVLVEDVRAGVTPAEMVEQKLRSLLRTRGISIELASRARPARGPGR